MRDTDLFSSLLGLNDSWEVTSVEFKPEKSRVEIHVSHVGVLSCPICGTACALYDQSDERSWRHLDTMRNATFVIARITRSNCPTQGVKQIDVHLLQPGVLSLVIDGRSFRCILDEGPTERAVLLDGKRFVYALDDPRSLRSRRGAAADANGPRPIKAPMPGRVVKRETYLQEYHELTHKDGVPFVPDAFRKDFVASGLVILALVACAAYFGPFGPKGQPDPTVVQAVPKPDYFFLWMYAALALLPPSMETFLLIVGPVIAIGFLIALPLISH